MKFQKKLIMIYTVFGLIVTLFIAILYYALNSSRYKENEYNNLNSLSNMNMQQFENLLKNMESVSTYLLSDANILTELKSFATLKYGDSFQDVYFSNAGSTIRHKLNTYYFMDNFYRVIVFNKIGNVVASNNYSQNKISTDMSYKDIAWTDKVIDKGGKSIILGEHIDNWGEKKQVQVISLAKEILGFNEEIIEVQQDIERLDKMFISDSENLDIAFVNKSGELIYRSSENLDYGYYFNESEAQGKEIKDVKDENGKKSLLSVNVSDEYDLILLTIKYTDITQNTLQTVLPLTILLLSGFAFLWTGFVYITSNYLTKPLRQLKDFMEKTQIHNLDAEIPQKIPNDEIETLYLSYKSTLERLEKTIVEEKRMSNLQLKAQFDLLQAQVNPHFIYNVLNVISNRGIVSDDEIICDICSDLAEFLRYSTNTKEKFATVESELQYMELYLSLMKYRYEHKLRYSFDVSDNIKQKILPKIVIQQLVENSIIHGYENCSDIIEISVIGQKSENGWLLKIIDNGNGMSGDKIKEIYKRIEKIKEKLSKDRGNVELEIGGMGLVNSYARLFLMYEERLNFEISSEHNKGTEVSIIVADEYISEVKNVQYYMR